MSKNLTDTQSEILWQTGNIVQLMDNIQSCNEKSEINDEISLINGMDSELRNDEYCFFRLDRLSYEEDRPKREAFENVLLSLNDCPYNLVYILKGSKDGVELYLGVVKNSSKGHNDQSKPRSANDYGDILKNSFDGNFGGSKLERVKGVSLTNSVISSSDRFSDAGVIVGVPSVYSAEKDDKSDFQGIDRLINSMLGLEWQVNIVCEPVQRSEILEVQRRIYSLYNQLSLFSKQSVQFSSNSSKSDSSGTNSSNSFNEGWNESQSKSSQHGKQGEHRNSSSSISETRGKNGGISKTRGSSLTYGNTSGTSNAITFELANKQAQELMKYMDDVLLPRLQKGISRGIFKTSVQYMASTPSYAERLKSGLISLLQGNETALVPMYAYSLNMSEQKNRIFLRLFRNQFMTDSYYFEEALDMMTRPFDPLRGVGLCTYLTPDELSLVAGLPQNEVPGISLKEGVGFGLNCGDGTSENGICLGTLIQKERILNIPFCLNNSALTKHIFIAGVTGSGKTTTCHRLLSEAKIPFLVIEPAKTEYRTLIRSKKINNVLVFTMGTETVAPFRFNPFELIPGENISSHVDMMKATFTSAFPMEASMPQILEEAIYACYEVKGWNIHTNCNDKIMEPFKNGSEAFPTMSELLIQLKNVVKTKSFGANLAADYEGSLISRLSNLTVGSKGSMLDCSRSVDFNYIAEHNVVIEMEGLKSPEDKSLMMGFILSRLSAVIRQRHLADPNFRHITLIEEAHRLLSKVEYGDSGSKKAAVETFSDLLAEIRKYGEGLIVVDQIPNKLAPEVLKNTNTKIIHRLFAKDDKEAVGDMMLMDDKQKAYLSSLDVGSAIIFTEKTPKPVHVKIKSDTDTNEAEIPDSFVRMRFEKYLREPGQAESYEGYYLENLDLMMSKISRSCEITSVDDNNELRHRLLTGVSEASEALGISSDAVWKILVHNNYARKRNALSEKYVSEIVNFYSVIFSEASFSFKQFFDGTLSVDLYELIFI